MNPIIFLNLTQVKLLESMGIRPKMLTIKAIEENLTCTDFCRIKSTANLLQRKGKLLYSFGFQEPEDENEPLMDGLESEIAYPSGSVVVNATCPSEGGIVLWEEEVSPTNANDMFKRSLINILNAFKTVMAFESLKNTKQFELCLLQQFIN